MGTTMAAKIPMMAQVMMSSVRVKPLLFFSLIFPSVSTPIKTKMEKGHTTSPLSESGAVEIDDQKRKEKGQAQARPFRCSGLNL